jgi:hypothetical protein
MLPFPWAEGVIYSINASGLLGLFFSKKIVNASCLWPLLLGSNAFTHGRIDSRSTVNVNLM